VGVAFAATPNETVAPPWPLVLSVTIHAASERIVQVHSPPVVIEIVPDPPFAGNELDEVTALIEHFAALGAVSVDVDDEPQPPNSRRALTPRKNPPSRTRAEGQSACHNDRSRSRSKRVVSSSRPKHVQRSANAFAAFM
jgi:hypothetical protein